MMPTSTGKSGSTYFNRHKTSIIVPCAGFGTRVGSPPAKELLLHPETQRPLIETCIDVAEFYGWNLVFITRPEKKILMDYVLARLKESPVHCQWVLVNKTEEWPDSILKSSDQWSEKNILILPDTDWAPQGIESSLVEHLDIFDVSYGLFNPSSTRTWGTVAISENRLRLCEKPQQDDPEFAAWGLIAFKKPFGKPLFSAILQSTMDHRVKELPLKANSINLDSFRDLTR
jgi:dTDP-glucose pyrophosphorylase